MMASFGWSYLARDTLRRAEAQLAGEIVGVRDEIGFLLLHQRYADRFFPGTSVLHTRLRYVLFVPWLYLSLRQRQTSERVERALQTAEIALAGRLRNAPGSGAVGGQIYPKPATQPPSVIYWTALGAWGFLRHRADGRLPSRAAVSRMLQLRARPAFDDDGQPLAANDLPFVSLPSPPKNWDDQTELDFVLTDPERALLFEKMTTISSPAHPGQKSLLARLAQDAPIPADSCWSPAVVASAGNDAPTLRRCGDVASLAAIGRGVYAALVETIREEVDKRPTSRRHRDYLPRVIAEHAIATGRVSLDEVFEDVGSVPDSLARVLRNTQEWLAAGAKPLMALRVSYQDAEWSRKRQRSRLTDDLNGRDRRLEWSNDDHAEAEPLQYRWNNVSRLLRDLWRAS